MMNENLQPSIIPNIDLIEQFNKNQLKKFQIMLENHQSKPKEIQVLCAAVWRAENIEEENPWQLD